MSSTPEQKVVKGIIAETEAHPQFFSENKLMHMFDELTFREKIGKILEGLKQPPDTGEYKWAKFEKARLISSFGSAFGTPLMILLLAVILGAVQDAPRPTIVEIMQPDVVEPIDDIKPIEPELEPVDVFLEAPPAPFAGPPAEIKTPGPSAENFSPQPAELDTVAITRSPLVFPGIYGGRPPGAQGSPDGGFDRGNSMGTELIVLRALRWMKKYQESDGSWSASSGGGPGYGDGSVRPAMTGLALLAFLGHGETPTSEEFGATVEAGIKYLIASQDGSGRFSDRDKHDYSHPIATYALAEGFALTRIPTIKDAAEKACAVIVNGQNAVGGWNYNCDKSSRNDISYTAWCVQALKACYMAGLQTPGLKDALKKAVGGIKANYAGGKFCYTPGQDISGGNLTAAGVLGLQFLGAGNDPATQGGISFMSAASCNWTAPLGTCPIYYWYYITQARFQAGGATWDAWNNQFAKALAGNQQVIKDVYEWKGQKKDIGYWIAPGPREFCQAYTYNTALCALMLEVYYRYLPTYKEIKGLDEEVNTNFTDKNDVTVNVGKVDIEIL